MIYLDKCRIVKIVICCFEVKKLYSGRIRNNTIWIFEQYPLPGYLKKKHCINQETTPDLYNANKQNQTNKF